MKYPIRAVARMTGLGLDTLRAWERRHHAVTPARDHRGRMYSQADVRRLLLLRDAVANGHAIGRVAGLGMADLRAAVGKREDSRARAAAKPVVAAGITPLSVVTALERFDVVAVEDAIARAAGLLSTRQLIDELLLPALAIVGSRWQQGQANIAHEHLLSSIVRNVLGVLMRTHTKRSPSARLVFATPSGEHHELGTLAAATVAATGGLGVMYLGPDLPAREIASLVKVANADVVVLGVTAAADRLPGIRAAIEALRRTLPRSVDLWIGGPAAGPVVAALGARATAVPTLSALEEQLVRLGAIF